MVKFSVVDGITAHVAELPTGEEIASVLVQDEVPASYSGALVTGTQGTAIIEGVAGYGDSLMLGDTHPIRLPGELTQQLETIHSSFLQEFGSVRVEWVFDGNKVWIVQLQEEPARSSGSVIVSGETDSEVEFKTGDGLEKLRDLVMSLRGTKVGIRLIGNIGMTSHMADILRRAEIPSRLIRLDDQPSFRF